MPDNRSRREKLEAMAAQTASPNEAEIARRLLAEMDAAGPRERVRVEHRADEFLGRMRFTYSAAGVKVDYDGPREPGVLASMLREALRRAREVEKAQRLD